MPTRTETRAPLARREGAGAEIEALTRNLARQSAAIKAFQRRHGVNDLPPGSTGFPVDNRAVRWPRGTSRHGQPRTARKAAEGAKGGRSWSC